MKVLVTGGCGFLGHHVVEHLLKNTDWEIVILDRLSYAGKLDNATKISRVEDIAAVKKETYRVTFHWHDLAAPVPPALNLSQLDYVIHLAAETHVDRSLENCYRFALSNVLGTANLLEYLRKYQPLIKKIINFSTDEVYGPAKPWDSFREWDTMKPSNPYAATKAGQDMLAFSFAHAYEMPIVITRCMNIFGERQHPEKFIPKTIRAILSDKPVELHGSAENPSSRCWIHARNVADALTFLLAAETRVGDMFHIVGVERTINQMASAIAQALRTTYTTNWVDFHACRPGHDLRYALNGSKLEKEGWRPPLTFDESLSKTVKWYLNPKHSKWLEG